jgi:acetoin utilization deacetylase AcuC-like enzyme
MAHFVYSPAYYCDIGAHVFPTRKFELVFQSLLESGVSESEFLAPAPADRRLLALVHTPEYLEDLFTCRATPRTLMSEMPLSAWIVGAFTLGAGGSVVAALAAVGSARATLNLGGGFHHAFPDWAEGFCYINDVALSVRALQAEGLVRRAAVIDCDLHQGNGTAVIFEGDPDVFTFSIHQENNYPLKRRSDLDIGLDDFTGDEEYLELLGRAVPEILDGHRPEFVAYVAGADPFAEDRLGRLGLTREGLAERDRIVIGHCARRGVPVSATLAGGYALDLRDTVAIHAATARTILELSDG